MAQKARMVLAMLALIAGGAAAEAGDTRERHEPIVLNGTLHTGDFSGGVGTGASGGTYYVQGWTYVSGSGSSSYSRTTAFVAAARASAFSGHGH
jgi:hypothetical protein